MEARTTAASVRTDLDLGGTHPLRLERPIVIASGPLGFGAEVSELIDLRDVGLFVTRGVSLAPRSGPSLPRIVEVPGGLLHAILRENPGVDDIIDRHASAWRAAPCAVALSLVSSVMRSILIAATYRMAFAGDTNTGPFSPEQLQGLFARKGSKR